MLLGIEWRNRRLGTVDRTDPADFIGLNLLRRVGDATLQILVAVIHAGQSLLSASGIIAISQNMLAKWIIFTYFSRSD